MGEELLEQKEQKNRSQVLQVEAPAQCPVIASEAAASPPNPRAPAQTSSTKSSAALCSMKHNPTAHVVKEQRCPALVMLPADTYQRSAPR